MGFIKSSLFISLDGVIEAPETWHFPYFNDEMGAVVGEQMAGNDATLLGRQTYDEFAGYWPTRRPRRPDHRGDERRPQVRRVELARPRPRGRTRRSISGDVAAELTELKQTPASGTTGSATLVRWMLERGLVDELHLLVHPIVVGHGKKLFADGATVPLKLVSSTTFEHRRAAPGLRRRGRAPPPPASPARMAEPHLTRRRPCATW